MEIIDHIPLEFNLTELSRNLRPQRLRDELTPIVERARPLIEPKAAYTTSHVTGFENGVVYLENGHALRSLVLEDMLELGQEVMPFVVTIGPKLDAEISGEKNMIRSYLLDRIGNYAVRTARTYLKLRAEGRLRSGLGSVSQFSPGETGAGELFGIEQQTPLFQILEPATESIGVHLSSSLMMIPQKSSSGLFAVTEQEYEACFYCPRQGCEGRRAPYVGEYERLKHA